VEADVYVPDMALYALLAVHARKEEEEEEEEGLSRTTSV